MAFEKLFEPIKLGSVEIKNRYAYAPTNFMFSNWEGLVDEQELAYYTARAMGGTGLIIYGAAMSTEFGVPYMQHPWPYCFDIRHVPGLSTFAEIIRLAGSVPFIQLLPVPSGRGRNWKEIQPVAPSAGKVERPLTQGKLPISQRLIEERLGEDSWVRNNVGTHAPPLEAREITLDEIQTVIKQNTKACTLAAYAGFDGIELHLCHGYLVDAFRTPLLNRRTDKYGGSEENRNRLLLELTEQGVRAAKRENPKMVVGVRVGAEGFGEGAYTFEETKRLALQLQDLGIDYWHCTMGAPPPPGYDEDGFQLRYTKELKKILKIPVITYGFHDPTVADKGVTSGEVDMVALATPLFADPEYVNKVKENRVNDINKCTNCMLHTVRDAHGLILPGRCAVNPELGFERYNPKYHIRQGFTKAGMLPHVLRK